VGTLSGVLRREGQDFARRVESTIQSEKIGKSFLPIWFTPFRGYRRLAESTPLTLQNSDYAHAVHELNKAIDRAEALCSNDFPSDAMQNPLSPPH
jgi:hypothetical protein